MSTQAWGRQPTFYVALTGLEENIGDIIPRALPWAGLFCPCRAEDGRTRTNTDRINGGHGPMAELVNKEYRWEFSPP